MKLPLLAVVGCSALVIVSCSPSVPGFDHGPGPDGVRFARLLKSIADQGTLARPARLAHELSATMTFRTESKPRYSNFRVTTTTEIAEISQSWFKSGPEGVRAQKTPETYIHPSYFRLNPPVLQAEPSMSFQFSRSTLDENPSVVLLDATLSFSNVFNFSCLTTDYVKGFTGADVVVPSHGPAMIIYSPASNEAYGVSLEFSWRMGLCATTAEIRQGSSGGFRYLRARAKLEACEKQVEDAYCATVPAGRYPDSTAVAASKKTACGILETYLAKEPPGGGPPRSVPYSPLCGRW